MKRLVLCAVVVLVLCGTAATGRATTLVINEFMAINDATLADQDNDFPDWIEIYNPTDSGVNLDGWYLTDNITDLTQWKFPAYLLGSGDGKRGRESFSND